MNTLHEMPRMSRLIDNLISALNICCRNNELTVESCKKLEQILVYNLDKCQQLMCLLTRAKHLKEQTRLKKNN